MFKPSGQFGSQGRVPGVCILSISSCVLVVTPFPTSDFRFFRAFLRSNRLRRSESNPLTILQNGPYPHFVLYCPFRLWKSMSCLSSLCPVLEAIYQRGSHSICKVFTRAVWPFCPCSVPFVGFMSGSMAYLAYMAHLRNVSFVPIISPFVVGLPVAG